jgi:hypothetical protein
LQEYLENYSDCLIARERLSDKDDKVISGEGMMALIGHPN